MVTCGRCGGKGKISWAGSTIDPICPVCHGKGTVPPYGSSGSKTGGTNIHIHYHEK